MKERCSVCNGSGKIDNKVCDVCAGKGHISIKTQLEKFIGIYRVKAHYDTSTNDYPKIENIRDGKIKKNTEPSFDDFYIACANNIEIKDAFDKTLMVYIPSLSIGRNRVKKLILTYGESILFDYDETSKEVMFFFKTKDIEKIATVIKPQTSGASIRPLSSKNLPKKLYKIPECDLEKYDKLKEFIPKITMLEKVGGKGTSNKEIIIPNGLIIKSIMSDFNKIIIKNKGENYDIEGEKKLCCMKGKEFIHYIGLWDAFIEFMEIEIKKY